MKENRGVLFLLVLLVLAVAIIGSYFIQAPPQAALYEDTFLSEKETEAGQTKAGQAPATGAAYARSSIAERISPTATSPERRAKTRIIKSPQPCIDSDGDGYQNLSNPLGCMLSTKSDCDDADPAIKPEGIGAVTDYCDGKDQNCDGIVDGNTVNGEHCPQCSDTDSGDDPEAGGTVTDVSIEATGTASDVCTGNVLTEKFCGSYFTGSTSMDKTYDCTAWSGTCIDADGNGPVPAYCSRMQQPTPRGQEICDGKDNDGDGIIDGRVVNYDYCKCLESDSGNAPDTAGGIDMSITEVIKGVPEVIRSARGDVCKDNRILEEQSCVPPSQRDYTRDYKQGKSPFFDVTEHDCSAEGKVCSYVQTASYSFPVAACIPICADRDGDGWAAANDPPGCILTKTRWGVGGDCNDNNPNISPGATEVCNQIDDDCSGVVDQVDTCAPAGNINDPSWPYDQDAGCQLLVHADLPDQLQDACGGKMATASGTITPATGKFQDALGLGGASYVSYPSLALGKALVVEAWVKITAYPATGTVSYIFSQSAGQRGGVAFYLYVNEAGNLAAGKSADCSADQYLFGQNPMPLNTWTHVRLSYDETANKLELYLNKALDTSITPTVSGLCKNSIPFTIGADGMGNSKLKGVVDEIRVSNVQRIF